MAPVKPKFSTAGQTTVYAFDGAIISTVISLPTRVFAFEVTFNNHHPRLLSLADQKPPLHFHPFQTEYIEVLEGTLGFEVNGKQHNLTKADGEFCVEKMADHRLYPCVTNAETTRFLLSGSETLSSYKLDEIFFQNWYGYQDQVILHKEKVDLIQVISMFDAGGSYLSLPWFVPFRHAVSRGLSVVVGRWLGGVLGYQPFHREWTNDWDTARSKMAESYFQKRFAEH